LAELAYVKGATSNIQNQLAALDDAQPDQGVNTTSSPTFANLSVTNTLTANKITGVAKEIYNQISNVTITNTVTETSLLSGNASTRTIPANSLSAGDIVIIEAMGTLTTVNNSQTAQVKVKLNSSDLAGSSQLQLDTTSALSNDLFVNRFYIKFSAVGASGSAQLIGYTMIHPGTGIVQPKMRELVSSAITINTTQNIVIDETYTWGSANAGNSITMIMVHIEKS